MSRELRPKDRAPQAPTLLTDVDRLPIDAAVDMVVMALRSGGRLLNTALSARLSDLQPPRRGALAGRLLHAWAAHKHISEQDRQEIEALCPMLCSDEAGVLEATAMIGLNAGEVAALMVGPALMATRRERALRDSARRGVSRWDPAHRWREHEMMSPRDAFASGLIEQCVARAELEEAKALAKCWPPARTAMSDLAAALVAEGDVTGLRQLLRPYDARGPLYSALVRTVGQVAGSMGARGESIASWLLSVQLDGDALRLLQRCTPAKAWPRRLRGALDVCLDAGEAQWLVEALKEQADSDRWLELLAEASTRRPRTHKAALDALRQRDPARAFSLGCVTLLDELLRGDAACSPQSVKRRAKHLQACAKQMGAPGLMEQWVELVRRELGEQSVALRALR